MLSLEKSAADQYVRYFPPPVSKASRTWGWKRTCRGPSAANSRTSGNVFGRLIPDFSDHKPIHLTGVLPVKYQTSPIRMSLTVRSKPWLDFISKLIGSKKQAAEKVTDHCSNSLGETFFVSIQLNLLSPLPYWHAPIPLWVGSFEESLHRDNTPQPEESDNRDRSIEHTLP